VVEVVVRSYDLILVVLVATLILLLYIGGFTASTLFSDDVVVEAPVVESSAIIFEEGELVEWEAAPIYYDWNGDLIVTNKGL
jgi:hypothetical protein